MNGALQNSNAIDLDLILAGVSASGANGPAFRHLEANADQSRQDGGG
jgi:hypothetical protein